MSLLNYMFQSILNTFAFGYFFGGKKFIIFTVGGYPPPPPGKFRGNNQFNFLTCSIDPVKDMLIFKPSKVHNRNRAAENLWDNFENYHLTQKVRSAGDLHFSGLCDRVGYNTMTEKDIQFLTSRDIDCPLAEDPENFKQGKVAYIVAENKRREQINKKLLYQFYVEQNPIRNVAKDQMAKDVFVDPSLPYTQTGGLPSCLELKKFVPVMITVNSSCRRYKENGNYDS